MASGKTDEAKGRVKEAVGALTGDDKLKNEGKADQIADKIKKAAKKVQNKTEEVIDDVKDALS